MPKILAIDDINDNLVSLKAIIDDTFPETVVYTALNGTKGIELAIANNPDVILLDIIMPGMDGFEVCRLLKLDERVRDIPVVFLTALKGDKENRIKALEVGAEGFLSKPIDEIELTAQIRAMVKIKASNEQKRDEKEHLKQLVDERTASLQKELKQRKKAEKLVRESEERFQMLFNQAPLGYQSLDFDGHFIDVNQQWLDTLGYTREEVIGKWFGDFLSPNYQEGFRKRFPLFKAQGQIHSEFEMVHKNGSKLFIAFEGKIGYDLSGEFKQTHCILQDITERKKAEEALRLSEEAYKRVVDNVDEIIYSVSFNGNPIGGMVNFVSAQAEKILGYAPEEFYQNSQLWFSIIHPDDVESVFSQTSSNFESRNFEPRIYRMKHKHTGEYVWIEDHPKFLFDEKGNVIGQYGTARDITLRKEAEEALQESEAKFREFFEKAADAIFIAEIDSGIIMDVNQAALRLMNRTYEQLIGIHQSQLHPPVKENYAKDTFQKHKELVKQKINSYTIENTVVRADGIEVPVEILASEVDYHGKRCMMGTFRDITERKRAEDKLHENIARLDLAMSTANMAWWEMDMVTGRVLFEKRKAEMLGYSPEKFKHYTDFMALVHPEDYERTMDAMRLHLNGSLDKYEVEYRIKTISGDYIWFSDIGSVTKRDSEGKPIIVSGLVLNISERKEDEELLRESEYFFKESQRAAFVGSYKFDIVADHWTSSEVLDQILGIDQSYTRSLNGWLHITHPDDRAMMSTHFLQEVIAKRNDFNKEYRIISQSDGEIRWVLGLGKLNFDADGNATEMIGTIQDITTRKLAEEARKESYEFNQSLLKTIPFGIDIVDEYGNILFQNGNFENVFGKNAVGGKCWEFYRDDKSQCIDCPLHKGIEIGETAIYESAGVLGGRIFEISHTGMMFKGKKAMLEIFQDITERKESEIALQESEDRYKQFITQVSEGVFRFECDQPVDISLPVEDQVDFIYDHMFIAECNDAFLRMYGIKERSEMIGKDHAYFHGGRDNQINREMLINFVRNDYHIENALTEEINTLGQLMFFSHNTMGIIENNQLVRIWGTQIDMTEKMHADKVQQVLYTISNATLLAIDLAELIQIISQELGKLLDSTNFFIAFYDEQTNMLSTIYEKDEKDTMQFWSAEKSMTGYLIRSQKSILIHEPEISQLIDSGEIENFGTPSKVWLGVPLKMNKKVIGAIVVQSYDNPEAFNEKDKLMLEFISHQICISIERKKAEQELNKALVKAQESDRLKSAFLANMSHEIRTPLNSIIGFSDLLLDPEFDEEQKKSFAENISQSGNGLLAIISDIMDLSKIETGQVQVNKSKFSINRLIRDIQREYSFRTLEKGIELRIDPLNPKEEIFIDSDPNKLGQVLINFVGNALKFTEKGFIEMGIRDQGDFVYVQVKDTGIGIPEEYHDKIFDRFRQVESAESRKYGGNGLGLAISKSLIEILGGEIGVESVQGKGSTFYFTIPKQG